MTMVTLMATWRRCAALLAGVAIALAVLAAAPARSQAEVVWLCHPGQTPDPCELPLDTTTLHADGAATVSTPPRAPDQQRPVDCFYVYPTVSNQLALNATKAKDPELGAVASYQASRFSQGCRMFAPVYRQATVAGVAGNALPASAQLAYSDVRQAWRDYLAHDNGGRGVILIGHSQGSLMLRELIRQEIDPHPAARRLLTGAFLLGGNVTVSSGQDRGGDFQHVPLCIRRGQSGCVVAYSTYPDDPLVPFFGSMATNAALSTAFGFPTGAGFQIACTDPAPLSGLTGPAQLLIPTTPFPAGAIAAGIAATANGPIPTAPTAWVQAFSYEGACRTVNSAHIYRYHPVDGSRALTEFPPTWGSHLVDFNLGTERLTTIARLQAQSWLAAGFGLGRKDRNTRRGTATLAVDAPGAGTVTLTAPGVLRRQRVRLTGPRTVKLTLRPTARTTRILRRHHSHVVTGRVTYTPTGGDPIVRTKRVRLILGRR